MTILKYLIFCNCNNKTDEEDENINHSKPFINYLSTNDDKSAITTNLISAPLITLSSSNDNLPVVTRRRPTCSHETKTSIKPFLKNFLSLRSRAASLVPHQSDFDSDSQSDYLNQSINSDLISNYYRSSTVIMNSMTAVKNLEAHLGYDLAFKLIFDQSSMIQDALQHSTSNNYLNVIISSNKQNDSNRNSIESNLDETEQLKVKSTKTPEQLYALRKQKADEYYHIEEKQANLLKLLASNVYKKFQEENERQQYALCDQENMSKIFYILAELSQVAELVHGEVASQLKQRVTSEWEEKPFFGDILIQKYQYYKTYNAILQRFPTCQVALSNMLKKKAFSHYLKQLLEAESVGLDKVNRIDILLDRLVDFPRRSCQLLESYLKNLDEKTKEHEDIESNY